MTISTPLLRGASYRLACLLSSFLLFFSCTDDVLSEEDKEQHVDLTSLKLTAETNYESDKTTKLNWESDQIVVWNIGDQIEIYDQENNRVVFESVENVGTAEFEYKEGVTEFSIHPAYGFSMLVAHYPPQNTASFQDYVLRATGQKQTGNDSRVHLSDATFLRGTGLLFANAHVIHISLNHEMALFAYLITVPSGLNVQDVARIDLEASNNVFFSDQNDTTLQGTETSTLSIETDFSGENISVGETLKVYMMMIPTELTDEPLRVALYDSSNHLLAYQDMGNITVSYVASTRYPAPVTNLTVN